MYLQPEDVILGANPRLPERLHLEPLAESIRQDGLLQRPLVARIGDEYIMIAGHRRWMAIRLLSDDEHKRLFPQGIPVIVRTGLTRDEVERAKVDHGNMIDLSCKAEVYLAAEILLRAGATEKEVATTLTSLLDRVFPLRASARRKLQDLDAKILEARGKARSNLCKERDDFYASYRRGVVQELHNVFRAPSLVRAAFIFKDTGVKPEGFEKVTLPQNITTAQIRKCFEAHQQDMRDKPLEYTKDAPGPMFLNRWQEIIASEEGEESPTKRRKSLSAKAMMDLITDGVVSSKVGKLVVSRCAGDAVEGLDAFDSIARCAELVSAHDADLWRKVTASARRIEEQIRTGKIK